MLRGFRGGPYAFDMVMDIGAYRDLHRHRRCQQFRQGYSGELGYDTPAALAEAGVAEVYDPAMKAAFAAMQAAAGAGGAVFAAVRGAVAVPVQDGFRRGGVHRAAAKRREGPLQLPRDRLGDEVRDGRPGAGAGAADGSDAAVGGGPAEEVAPGSIATIDRLMPIGG